MDERPAAVVVVYRDDGQLAILQIGLRTDPVSGLQAGTEQTTAARQSTDDAHPLRPRVLPGPPRRDPETYCARLTPGSGRWTCSRPRRAHHLPPTATAPPAHHALSAVVGVLRVPWLDRATSVTITAPDGRSTTAVLP